MADDQKPSTNYGQFPATHPVWKILNLTVILFFLTVFLFLNATTFDKTEIKSIIYMAFAAGGWEVLKGKFGGNA